MVSNVVVNVSALVVGIVIGGAVVFGVIKLTDNSSANQIISSNATGTRANDSLRLVIVVSRHGNRNGRIDYPDDPYPIDNVKYWPYGPSSLTPVGREQAYKLGQKLRSLYNGFLPSTFRSEDIYARSDMSERVVLSGEVMLAGLYPPQGWQVWNSDVKWQPIALYTTSPDRSEVVDACPKFVSLQNQYVNQVFVSESTKVSEMIDYIYNQTKKNISSDELTNMYDKLNCENGEGYNLPSWAKQLYTGVLEDFTLKIFIAHFSGNDAMVRLIQGELFDDLVNSMKKKINSTLTPNRKMVFVSGHDNTVIPLQVALGIPRSSLKIVKPGSALIMELHEDPQNQHSVQVLYIDGSSSDLKPVAQSLPKCGDPCPFDKFLISVQNFTDVRYEEECQISNSTTATTRISLYE